MIRAKRTCWVRTRRCLRNVVMPLPREISSRKQPRTSPKAEPPPSDRETFLSGDQGLLLRRTSRQRVVAPDLLPLGWLPRRPHVDRHLLRQAGLHSRKADPLLVLDLTIGVPDPQQSFNSWPIKYCTSTPDRPYIGPITPPISSILGFDGRKLKYPVTTSSRSDYFVAAATAVPALWIAIGLASP